MRGSKILSEKVMGRGTALITGASNGIGEAFAKLFAKEGFNLILTARSEDKLKSLSASFDGIETEFVIADLSEAQGIEKLIKEVNEKGKEVDVVVWRDDKKETLRVTLGELEKVDMASFPTFASTTCPPR